MKNPVPFLSGAAIAALLALMPSASGQEAPPEKVKKHYEMLLKRPAPGYLFDRFYNGWLDTATLEDMEKFLVARVKAESTTANHLLLAFYYARQGDSVKAIAQFRTALEKDPGSADAWYQKAVVEARTLNFDTALSDLEKAAAAKPREELLLTIRQFQGRLLIRSGKPDKAAEAFRSLIAAKPGNEDLREDIIELFVTEGLMDDAAAAARELISLTKDPQKKVLRRLRLGDILQRAGKREDAVDVYASTLADTGADSWLEKEIISQIEQVYRREDDISGLRERLKAMIAAEPKRLALRLAQTRMLTADGQPEPALKAWQEILALTPGDRALRETYIEQMAALKKLPEAIAQMKELVAQHGTDLELLPRLADLYFQQKDTAQCRATLQQFIEKSDKQEGMWLRTAAMFERYAMSADALELLNKAANLLPNSEAVAEAQAVTLHGMDKKAEAIAVWKKLAAGKSRERTLQVARLAAARNEMQAAFDILHDRLKDFESDPLYLAELVSSAVKIKHEAEALPWARRRIALTNSATDLEPALDDAVRIVAALDKEQDIIRETGPEASPQELSLAAALQESLGNPKKAEELLGRITAIMPELGGSLQVRLFITRGEPLKAAEAMKKVIELPEGRKSASVQRLVDLYQRAGRIEDAITWTAEWKRLSPGAVQPWETEAQLLTLSGKSGEALKSLRQASQMFPDNEDLKAGLARRYREEGHLADAQRILEQLYEDGKDPGAKLRWVSDLAQTAEQQGKTKELLESFEERRRTNRASTLPLLALSEIYRSSGSYEERRAALLEAARIKPDDFDLLMEIARIEQTQGELAMSLETLRKARPLDKGNRATQKAAEILFGLGKDDEALSMMQEIDSAKRLDPAAVETLVMSVIGTGEWERAEAFLKPLLAKYPDNYRLRYLYALALEELSRNDEARDLFLSLLRMEKEMQGARPAKFREYYIGLRRNAPDAAVQILDLMNSSGNAYSHRQRNGSSGYYTTINGSRTYVSNSSGTAQQPYLPGDLFEMRTLSLQHLATLSQSMEDQAVAALKKDLSGRGYVWAEFLTELSRRDSSGEFLPPQIANLLKAAPHEDYVLALLCLHMTYNAAGRYAPELREAFTKFKDRYPQLACIAFLSLLRHDDAADLPLLNEGTKLLAGIEQPIDTLSYSLSNVAWMASADNSGVKPERKAIAKVIMEKLEAMYAALPPSSNARLQLQNSIFQACMNRHEWPRMIEMLENQLAEALSSSSQVASGYRSYYSSYDNQFIVEPPFPPRNLPQMPASVSRRWGLDQNGGELYFSVPNDETEAFKTAVRAGKNPALRILLALRFNDEALVNEMIKTAEVLPEPDATVCTILAGWYSSRSEPDKALGWLRRTQFLPLNRDDRAIVDCYLLGVITLGGLNPAPDTPDFTAARDAVVRLRQTRLDTSKREAIASALTALGLPDDAEKLLAANAASRPSPPSSRASNSQASPEIKIEQLYKQGQKEKALTLILREFRVASRAAASGTLSRDTTALVRLAARLNLNEEILRQLKPADNATSGLSEYGWLCTAFDDKTGGRLWYEKAVAARPRDLGLRLTTAANYLGGEKPDVEAAWKLIDAAPPESLSAMSGNFNRFFGYYGTPDTQLASLEVLKRFLEKYRSTPGIEWGWAISALEYAVRQSSQGRISLPSLYAKTSSQSASLTRASQSKELETRRRKLHDEICGLLAEIPMTRTQAFTRVASLRLEEEKDGDDLVDLAKKALATKPDPNVATSISRYSYGYDDDGRQIEWQTAERYLAETALKRKDRTLLEETASEMDKQDRPAEAKALRAQADLYFCPEGEFETKARAQMLSNKPEDRVLNDNQIIQVWQKRKLGPVLNAALLERMNTPETRRSGYAYIPQDYLVALAAEGHLADAAALLKGWFQIVLGPEEKRAEMVRQNWNPRGYAAPGSPGYMLRNLRQQFYQFAQKDELAVLSMDLINDQLYRYSDDVRQDDYYGDNIRLESTALRDWPSSQKPERVKAILAASPFLAGLPEWHPVMNTGSRNSTVLAYMLKNYVKAGASPTVRKSGTVLLNAFPPSFGRDILLVAARAEKDEAMRRGVLDLLVSHRADLEKLPSDRLVEVAAFATEIAGDTAKLKPSPEALALVDWLKPKLPGSDTLAVFLKPAGKWDKPVNASEWQQKVRGALLLATKENPEKYREVITRARAMRVQGQPSPVSFRPRHDNSLLAQTILSAAQVVPDRKEIGSPAFWNSLLYAAEATLDPANDLDWDANGIDSSAKASFKTLWVDCLKDRSKTETLTEFTVRLGRIFSADQFRLYSQAFLNLLREQGKDKLTSEEMSAWASSPASQANPVAQECAHLLIMEAARNSKDKTSPPEAAVAAYTQHVMAFAKNEKLPLRPRLTMTAGWLNQAYKFLPPDLCRETAAMLTAAWQARRTYNIWDAENTFRAVLALPDAAQRIELLKPLLEGASKVSCIRTGTTLDEQLVAAAAQCGDKAFLERVAGSRSGRVHHGFLAAMLKEGLDDEARRWFEQNALSIGTKSTLDHAAWSPELAGKGAAFAKSLDAPHKSYLAEILIATLPSSDDSKVRAEQIHTRLLPLAKKFGSIIMPDDAWRDRIVELLATDDESIAEAAAFFAPMAEKEPLSVLARISGQPPSAKLRVLHLWIMHEFKERRFAPLEQFLSEMSIRRNSYYYSSSSRVEDPWTRALRDTLKLPLQFAFLHSQEWTPAEREKLGAIFRTTLEQKTFVTDANESEDVVQCALLYHAFTGQNATLQTWWKTIPDEQQKKIRERFWTSSIDVWPTKEDLEKRYGKDRAARLAFVKEYLANPVGVAGGDNSMDRMATMDWATRAEVLAMGDELLNREPRGSDTGRQLAVVAEKERAWDKAAAILAGTAEHLDKESQKDLPRILIQRTLMLLEAGKAEDALAETEKLQSKVIEPFKDGKVESESLVSLAKWIEARGRALMAVGRSSDALALLGINPSVQKLAMRESGGNLSEASMHEAVFRYAEAKTGIKIQNLIPKEATWRYRDAADAPPVNWYTADFEDKDWPSGQARLGYGDPVKTTLSFGPDPKQKPMAAYFRTTFDVTDLKNVNSVHLGIQRDDGCVVYLNGKEIVRQNMPEGTIDHTTAASIAIDQAAENEYFPVMLTPEHLVSGKNVLAVEVHQASPASTDLTFDLQMRANLPDPVEIMRTLDPAELGPKLGDLWTALPEPLRKALE